jgi:hypothetical protein
VGLLRAIFPPSKEARGRLYQAASRRTARKEDSEVGSPSAVADLTETDRLPGTQVGLSDL